jgi:hypothetical protein
VKPISTKISSQLTQRGPRAQAGNGRYAGIEDEDEFEDDYELKN